MKEVGDSRITLVPSLLIAVFFLSNPTVAKDVNSDESLAVNSEATYLLITNEELAPVFQALVDRRTSQGFPGKLVTIESISADYLGVDEPEKIRNCIIDHYINYGTEFVTLGGDQVIVPVRYCQPNSDGIEMPADLYYADMDGSDWDANRNGIYGEIGEVNEIELAPEAHLGRIPLRTSEDALAYINKVIIYETASPDGFANSMIVFGDMGFRRGDTRRRYFLHHDPVEDAETRQMEIYYRFIQSYWQALPLNFLWDGYSSWDTHVCGDYEFTLDSLIEKLNQGYHFVFAYGHGNPTRWGLGGRRFNVSHAFNLTNSVPSIVMSMSCSVACFDSDGVCMSEAFLQNPHGGAVVYFGHTRTAKGDQEFYHLFKAMFRESTKTNGEAMTEVMTTLAPDRVVNPYKHYNFSLQGDSCIQLVKKESGRRLQIFLPKGCEVIECGTDFYIRWNAAGTGFFSGERVKLEYSPDSGQKWHPVPGAESLPYNGGVFLWRNCPLPADPHYRVRVVSLSDPSVSDMSGRDFIIGDLNILTVQSEPIKGFGINLSGSNTDDCTLFTDFNITILNGATVSLSTPVIAGDSSEFAFIRWKDGSGNTMATTADYTFVLSQDKTFVAEYTEQQVEWPSPTGWWSDDIGTTGGGRSIQNGDVYEITGNGHDIGGLSDGFHFMYKRLTGNGSITARVVSNGTGNDIWAKGGVMIRDDLSPGSTHGMTVVTGGGGGGAAFQWRMRPDKNSGSTHDPIPSVSPPYWVRIERSRRYMSSYISSDGRTWRQLGVTKTILINDPVYIGLCVTSNDEGFLRTYTFDNVSYEGLVNDSIQN